MAAGAWVKVTETFSSNNAKPVELLVDMVGEILQIDDDGDAKIAFAGVAKEQYVFKRNFRRVAVITAAEAARLKALPRAPTPRKEPPIPRKEPEPLPRAPTLSLTPRKEPLSTTPRLGWRSSPAGDADGGGSGWGRGAQGDERAEKNEKRAALAEELRAFYRSWAPEMYGKAEEVASRFVDDEAALNRALVAKYGQGLRDLKDSSRAARGEESHGERGMSISSRGSGGRANGLLQLEWGGNAEEEDVRDLGTYRPPPAAQTSLVPFTLQPTPGTFSLIPAPATNSPIASPRRQEMEGNLWAWVPNSASRADTGGPAGTWQRRDFAIVEAGIEYTATLFGDGGRESRAITRRIPLAATTELVVLGKEHFGRSFCVLLTTRGDSYMLSMESESERQEWVQAIKDVIKQLEEEEARQFPLLFVLNSIGT
jgi:hypothetical protein